MPRKLSERYECNIGRRDLLTAISELNEPENNDERLQKIDNLRNAFVEENKDLKLMRNDDIFILGFLRVAKFDHNHALTMMKNYHTQLSTWPEVYEKVKNPFSVKHVFDAGCFVALRKLKTGLQFVLVD